jgi:glycerophosphoryl diester phosphodiesterase
VSDCGWVDALRRQGRSCARPGPLPLRIAHRGDSFHAPENTLEAAHSGWIAGADAWELDVQLTRDGVPVVLHDVSLVRTTNVAQRFAGDPRAHAAFPVAEFDLGEIRALDAGSWFLDPSGPPRSAASFGTLAALPEGDRVRFASGAVRVPTLAEALEFTTQRDWLVNVELKSSPSTSLRLLEAVLEVIDATHTAHRVLISSFDHSTVARSGQLRPEIPIGVLTSTPLDRPEHHVREEIGALAYHVSADALDRDQVAALHSAGIPVLVYTINDTTPGGLAARLAEAGVAGLFTDDPAGLVGLFRGDISS